MLFLLDTGINYDRVISERWGLFAGLKYELAGHMHGLYQGGTVEVGGKFLLWSHGERAFTKGVVAALGTGFGVGATTKHGDQNSQTMIEKRLWIPFTAAVHYMYTWDNNVFITAGLKSQIFQIQLPKAVVFYPYPRLELSVGYGF